jgi:hypothetical protein
VTRHQQGFTAIHPMPSLPFTRSPRTERGPLGFPASFTPGWAGPSHARHGRDRPRHWPGLRLRHQPTSLTYSLTTCDLMSQQISELSKCLSSRTDDSDDRGVSCPIDAKTSVPSRLRWRSRVSPTCGATDLLRRPGEAALLFSVSPASAPVSFAVIEGLASVPASASRYGVAATPPDDQR